MVRVSRDIRVKYFVSISYFLNKTVFFLPDVGPQQTSTVVYVFSHTILAHASSDPNCFAYDFITRRSKWLWQTTRTRTLEHNKSRLTFCTYIYFVHTDNAGLCKRPEEMVWCIVYALFILLLYFTTFLVCTRLPDWTRKLEFADNTRHRVKYGNDRVQLHGLFVYV